MNDEVKQMLENNNEYCKCDNIISVHSDTSLDEWGWWDVCDTCNKKIEFGFHYYSETDLDENVDD